MEIVKEIVTLVAEPLVIDELSMIQNCPVRAQCRCRDPSAVNGSVEFFFNGKGTFIKFEVEEGDKDPQKRVKEDLHALES